MVMEMVLAAKAKLVPLLAVLLLLGCGEDQGPLRAEEVALSLPPPHQSRQRPIRRPSRTSVRDRSPGGTLKAMSARGGALKDRSSERCMPARATVNRRF
jgi:hypothetical protein